MGNSVKISAAVTSKKGSGKDLNYNDYYLNGKFISEPEIDNSRAFLETASGDFIFAVSNAMSIEDLEDNTRISIISELKKYQERMREAKGDIGTRLNEVCQKVEETNSLIYSISLNNKDNRRNETSFSGLVVSRSKAAAISIGDTNVYIFRNARLRRLILDREKPDRLLKMGIINEEQAKSVARSTPSSSLHESIMGAQMSETIELNANDIFILSSGRLENLIDEDIISDILLSGADVNEMSERISEGIIKNNSDIDTTILVAKVGKVIEGAGAEPENEGYVTKLSDKLSGVYEKKQESIRTFIVAALTCIILAGIIAVTYKMLAGDNEKQASASAAKTTISVSGITAGTGTGLPAGLSPVATQSMAASGTAASASGTAYITYKVEAGDTLEKISRKFYNDPSKYTLIMEKNNITDPTKLRVGQILIIP